MSPTPSLPSPPTWVRRGVILDLFSHLEEKWWFGMKTCTDSYLHQTGGPPFHLQGLAPHLLPGSPTSAGTEATHSSLPASLEACQVPDDLIIVFELRRLALTWEWK